MLLKLLPLFVCTDIDSSDFNFTYTSCLRLGLDFRSVVDQYNEYNLLCMYTKLLRVVSNQMQNVFDMVMFATV